MWCATCHEDVPAVAPPDEPAKICCPRCHGTLSRGERSGCQERHESLAAPFLHALAIGAPTPPNARRGLREPAPVLDDRRGRRNQAALRRLSLALAEPNSRAMFDACFLAEETSDRVATERTPAGERNSAGEATDSCEPSPLLSIQAGPRVVGILAGAVLLAGCLLVGGWMIAGNYARALQIGLPLAIAGQATLIAAHCCRRR